MTEKVFLYFADFNFFFFFFFVYRIMVRYMIEAFKLVNMILKKKLAFELLLEFHFPSWNYLLSHLSSSSRFDFVSHVIPPM